MPYGPRLSASWSLCSRWLSWLSESSGWLPNRRTGRSCEAEDSKTQATSGRAGGLEAEGRSARLASDPLAAYLVTQRRLELAGVNPQYTDSMRVRADLGTAVNQGVPWVYRHFESINALDISPDGKEAAAIGVLREGGPALALWHLEQPLGPGRLKALAGSFDALAYARDGMSIYASSRSAEGPQVVRYAVGSELSPIETISVRPFKAAGVPDPPTNGQKPLPPRELTYKPLSVTQILVESDLIALGGDRPREPKARCGKVDPTIGGPGERHRAQIL